MQIMTYSIRNAEEKQQVSTATKKKKREREKLLCLSLSERVFHLERNYAIVMGKHLVNKLWPMCVCSLMLSGKYLLEMLPLLLHIVMFD